MKEYKCEQANCGRGVIVAGDTCDFCNHKAVSVGFMEPSRRDVARIFLVIVGLLTVGIITGFFLASVFN